jgi:hypothetical protein
MERRILVATLSGIVIICGPALRAQQPVNNTKSTVADALTDSAQIPPLPPGRTTIFGGQIRSVDPVRDQLTLDVYGQRPMRILFDERTQVYRDGKRVPLRDLTAVKHASVETTLDGSSIFAVSVHALSESTEGTYEGRILSYNAATDELIMSSGPLGDQFKVTVGRNTAVVRRGQSTFVSASGGAADLESGSLVSIQFAPGTNRGAVADRIEILAVPGAAFSFSGNISWIDLHTGLLVLTDPLDQKEHEIFFNPSSAPEVQDAHIGEGIHVVATYDGTRYVASAISLLSHR